MSDKELIRELEGKLLALHAACACDEDCQAEPGQDHNGYCPQVHDLIRAAMRNTATAAEQARARIRRETIETVLSHLPDADPERLRALAQPDQPEPDDAS